MRRARTHMSGGPDRKEEAATSGADNEAIGRGRAAASRTADGHEGGRGSRRGGTAGAGPAGRRADAGRLGLRGRPPTESAGVIDDAVEGEVEAAVVAVDCDGSVAGSGSCGWRRRQRRQWK